MTGRREQRSKGRKRPRSWHRGQGEADRWKTIELPDLGTDTPPTGAPIPVHRNRGPGNTNRGDVA
jgi:hypothetical protein